ncbi:MAG: flavin reductase family protein [Planctomycetota bacterium]
MDKKILGPTTWVFPLPCVLVSAGASEDQCTFSTISYVSVVNGHPPMIAVSVRKSRYTYSLISKLGVFGVNVPSIDILPETNKAGLLSGDEVNKFDKLLLTPFAGVKTGVILIQECPISLECKVVQTIELPSHTMFIGEVLQTYADREIVRDGKLVPEDNYFVCYGANGYWNIGERLTGYTMAD